MQNALDPVNKSVQDAADQISDLVERAPDLKFQINGRASSWLLTTFLDDVSPIPCDIGKAQKFAFYPGCEFRDARAVLTPVARNMPKLSCAV